MRVEVLEEARVSRVWCSGQDLLTVVLQQARGGMDT